MDIPRAIFITMTAMDGNGGLRILRRVLAVRNATDAESRRESEDTQKDRS